MRGERLTEVQRSTLTLGAVICLALGVSSCGTPVATTSSEAIATSEASTTATVADSTTTSTSVPEASARWLAPSSDLPSLRLVDASVVQLPDCGMTEDCGQTVAVATLAYDAADPTQNRHLDISQSSSSVEPNGRSPSVEGPERVVGDRRVRVVEDGPEELPSIQAGWTEPDGHEVRIYSLGISWEELAGIIGGLAPLDEVDWPGVEVQPRAPACVDAGSQLAPDYLPEGWLRFVLQIQPTGSCGQPIFLMMSVVSPGTVDAPGTLVTIVTAPASSATPQPGEPVIVNGLPGTLRLETTADGQQSGSLSVVIDTVAVEAHGNVGAEQLQEIVASVRPFDDAEWADLVNSVQQPPVPVG